MKIIVSKHHQADPKIKGFKNEYKCLWFQVWAVVSMTVFKLKFNFQD